MGQLRVSKITNSGEIEGRRGSPSHPTKEIFKATFLGGKRKQMHMALSHDAERITGPKAWSNSLGIKSFIRQEV